MTVQRAPQYRSFLLRCWEECDGVAGTRLWRYSLADAHTGQRHGFASLNDLLAALEAELTRPSDKAPDDNGRGTQGDGTVSKQ
jgi:hypothetical protein